MRLEAQHHSVGVSLNIIRFLGKAKRVHKLLEDQRAIAEAVDEPEEDAEGLMLAQHIVDAMHAIKFIGKLKQRSVREDKIKKLSMNTQVAIVEAQLTEAQQSGDLHAMHAALRAARYLSSHYTHKAALGVADMARQIENDIRDSDPELGLKLDLRNSRPVRCQIRRLW